MYIRMVNGGRQGPKEIDGLLVPKDKAYTLLTGELITGLPLRSEPAHGPRKIGFESKNPYKPWRLSWLVIFEALFGCHDVLILG